eukprot:g7321.t1
MYLKTVLQTLGTKKQLEAEDLYKLNEATFNVPEEESIDEKMATKLFAAVEKTVAAYTAGRYDKEDSNFFYDYVALLQVSECPHPQQLTWQQDALGGDGEKQKGNSKVVARLEEEHRKLQEEMNKLKDLSSAVQTLRSIRLPEADVFCSVLAFELEFVKHWWWQGEGKKDRKEEGTDDPARKELKAQVNAAGRALAKKKREVIDKYGQ